MTSKRFAQLLIEGPSGVDVILGRHKGKPDVTGRTDVDKKISVFFSRLLLRIFSVPSLMSYLNDCAIFPTEQAKNGECKIQLVFQRLPEEVYPQLIRLISAPSSPKLVRFMDDGQARSGVEMVVKPDDFGGEEYDYAT